MSLIVIAGLRVLATAEWIHVSGFVLWQFELGPVKVEMNFNVGVCMNVCYRNVCIDG